MRTELSFGSHFFQDLVEADIFYLSVPDNSDGSFMADDLLLGRRNFLAEYLPDQRALSPVIHVSQYADRELMLQADAGASKLTCWLNRE